MFKRTASGSVPIAGSVNMGVIRGSTARMALVDEDFRALEELAAGEEAAWQGSDLAKRIMAAMSVAPLVEGDRLLAFRGRIATESVHGWEDMGPPEMPPVGRYNRAGVSVLYLCTSEGGVRREKSGRLFVQEYDIDLRSARVADFADESNSGLLHAAFDVAERVGIDGRAANIREEFPRFLSDLAQQTGLDGFVVPGVRGDAGEYYNNAVLFNPTERWKAWSRRAAGFWRDP